MIIEGIKAMGAVFLPCLIFGGKENPSGIAVEFFIEDDFHITIIGYSVFAG